MNESSNLLQSFVERLMESEGAVIEAIQPDVLEFMAPQPLQQSLKIPEFGRFGFTAELREGTQRIALESDWLERFGKLLGDRGRLFSRAINPQQPFLSNPERMLEHALTLNNAVYRLIGVKPAWTRYVIIAFRYTAVSDEKRDGIMKIGVNLSNGSALDGLIEPMISAALFSKDDVKPSSETAIPTLWNAEKLSEFVQRSLSSRINQSLAQFLNGMQRRMERDLARLHDYYGDLRKESIKRIKKQPSEIDRERQRVEAIEREYRTKVADLQQKYAMTIEAEWVQTLDLIMLVQRFELLIKRRKGERRFHLDWNPIGRRLESPPCEYAYTSESVRMICDDAMHMVSIAAHSDCAKCGKAYCRACHPLKCPKCYSGFQMSVQA